MVTVEVTYTQPTGHDESLSISANTDVDEVVRTAMNLTPHNTEIQNIDITHD